MDLRDRRGVGLPLRSVRVAATGLPGPDLQHPPHDRRAQLPHRLRVLFAGGPYPIGGAGHVTTLCNALPPLSVTDLADRGGMNSKTLGDCLVSLGAGPDLPHDIVRDFELGYLGSVSGAPMPLPVFRVLQGSSSDDVSGIHAAGVPAEVPGMATTSGGGAPSNDQSGTMHAHLPAVQYDVSVMTGLRASTFLER